MVEELAELTLEARDISALESFSAPRGSDSLRGPVEHLVGDRSVYVEDPEGIVVESWELLPRGEGARDGVAALS